MNMTHHAEIRAQQRCIPPLIVDWLMEFGAREHDKHGAEVVFFDKRSKRMLAKEVGKPIVDKLSCLMKAYLVTCDGTVITTGYRHKRITRH